MFLIFWLKWNQSTPLLALSWVLNASQTHHTRCSREGLHHLCYTIKTQRNTPCLEIFHFTVSVYLAKGGDVFFQSFQKVNYALRASNDSFTGKWRPIFTACRSYFLKETDSSGELYWVRREACWGLVYYIMHSCICNRGSYCLFYSEVDRYSILVWWSVKSVIYRWANDQ